MVSYLSFLIFLGIENGSKLMINAELHVELLKPCGVDLSSLTGKEDLEYPEPIYNGSLDKACRVLLHNPS